MSPRCVTAISLAALAGAAMLTVSIGPVSAFTLSGPSLETPIASAQIERVWWDRSGRWHPDYYDDGPLGIVGAAGALATDAVVDSAEVVGDAVAGPGPCWHRYHNHNDGWHWRRVC
jgi:hypothetical protein